VSGPYEDEDQVLADPAVQAIYARMRGSRDYRMQDGSAALMLAACEAAGVQLGAYDARILRWLAGFEPQSAAVVAGIITRAAAGKPDATPGADVPRCAQCGGAAEEYPDPYMLSRKLWRHRRDQLPATVAGFLDAEHEAAPAGAL
jgi:hypothetical protein